MFLLIKNDTLNLYANIQNSIIYEGIGSFMKYLGVLSLILFGFLVHPALEEIYDYKFEQGFMSKECVDQYIKDCNNKNIDAPLTKRFQCTYKYIGTYAKLEYVLMRPHFSDDTGKRWYY